MFRVEGFKVQTALQRPQPAANPRGSVSLVTKSGTNDFHGDVFEFFRKWNFQRNSFAVRRDTIKRNQSGGTIGGPILKNKLFLFSGYQGTILTNPDLHEIASVFGEGVFTCF